MAALTVVFDLDGTLVDTAPDLIETLNVVFARAGLPPVDYTAARNMIGGGARKMIESGLKFEGHPLSGDAVDRMFDDFIAYYAAHVADKSQAVSRPQRGARSSVQPRLPLRRLHQQA